MNRDMLEIVVRDDMNRLVIAQALSASLGGCPVNLAVTITKQALWIMSGSSSFSEWIELTEESGHVFMDWYEWYSAIVKGSAGKITNLYDPNDPAIVRSVKEGA